MTKATLNPLGVWLASYQDRNGKWRIARNALGTPIFCDTRALALSVARYRRQRLKSFTQ